MRRRKLRTNNGFVASAYTQGYMAAPWVAGRRRMRRGVWQHGERMGVVWTKCGACGMTQRGYITADHCVYCGAETEENAE